MSDFKALEAFEKALKTYQKVNVPDMIDYIIKQISGRFLKRVVDRTPVEENQKYKYYARDGSIQTKDIKGGNLRRGWTAGTDTNPEAYANSLPVQRSGKQYEMTLTNSVEYAEYVEFGHKQTPGRFVRFIGPEKDGVRQGTYLKNAEVPGQHMMKDSYEEIEAMAPGLAAKLVDEYFRKHPL